MDGRGCSVQSSLLTMIHYSGQTIRGRDFDILGSTNILEGLFYTAYTLQLKLKMFG